MKGRKYKLQPLAAAVGMPMTVAFGRMLGMSGSTWTTSRDNGVGELAADRYAIRCGVHPHTIWPEMIDHALEDASVPCAECGTGFVPTRAGHTFCSKPCRERRRVRLRYQNDPEYRERRKADAKGYYEAAGPYVRARNRRYHQANRDRILPVMKARYEARMGRNPQAVPTSEPQAADGTVAA